MPLFECSKCHVVDNSALTNFWLSLRPGADPPLCSECDPQIGKWHGVFARTSIEDHDAKWGKDAVQYRVKGNPWGGTLESRNV